MHASISFFFLGNAIQRLNLVGLTFRRFFFADTAASVKIIQRKFSSAHKPVSIPNGTAIFIKQKLRRQLSAKL